MVRGPDGRQGARHRLLGSRPGRVHLGCRGKASRMTRAPACCLEANLTRLLSNWMFLGLPGPL